MFGGIVVIIVGILCIGIGISNYRGNIKSLHSYHTNNIKPEDVKPFGKLVGTGMIIIGVFLTVSGIFMAIGENTGDNSYITISTIIMTIGFVVGLPITLYAIKKYNKRIFG